MIFADAIAVAVAVAVAVVVVEFELIIKKQYTFLELMQHKPMLYHYYNLFN